MSNLILAKKKNVCEDENVQMAKTKERNHNNTKLQKTFAIFLCFFFFSHLFLACKELMNVKYIWNTPTHRWIWSRIRRFWCEHYKPDIMRIQKQCRLFQILFYYFHLQMNWNQKQQSLPTPCIFYTFIEYVTVNLVNTIFLYVKIIGIKSLVSRKDNKLMLAHLLNISHP